MSSSAKTACLASSMHPNPFLFFCLDFPFPKPGFASHILCAPNNWVDHPRCRYGAAMSMQRKAWMTGELFQAWLDHLIKSINEHMGFEHRHLRILDGHGSHVSLEVVAKAYDSGIDIVTLPAHTSHKLQPLDVSVFKSLKANFRKERAIWQQKTASSQASKGELATIASKALTLSFTAENIKARFRATGIWPLDANAVTFEGIPCNHIEIIEENINEVGDESQVPNTPTSDIPENLPSASIVANTLPSIEGELPTMEGEAVDALKAMAADNQVFTTIPIKRPRTRKHTKNRRLQQHARDN
ncbi:hypothetical protein GOP47_0011632 [Adiantum capillus-veneris]|uniref:DDE-1 domain-containing protein n=1 Tax=Adiantum capillus-veneris TaxID=13818 RepID=A0A9D4UTJ5_ADICA|nr:hypothetical protein GOP47_0011632 [Adiantum capillus-veneris]